MYQLTCRLPNIYEFLKSLFQGQCMFISEGVNISLLKEANVNKWVFYLLICKSIYNSSVETVIQQIGLAKKFVWVYHGTEKPERNFWLTQSFIRSPLPDISIMQARTSSLYLLLYIQWLRSCLTQHTLRKYLLNAFTNKPMPVSLLNPPQKLGYLYHGSPSF